MQLETQCISEYIVQALIQQQANNAQGKTLLRVPHIGSARQVMLIGLCLCLSPFPAGRARIDAEPWL